MLGSGPYDNIKDGSTVKLNSFGVEKSSGCTALIEAVKLSSTSVMTAVMSRYLSLLLDPTGQGTGTRNSANSEAIVSEEQYLRFRNKALLALDKANENAIISAVKRGEVGILIALLRGERAISDAALHKRFDKELFDFNYAKEVGEEVKPPLVIAAGANSVDVLNFILSKNGGVDVSSAGGAVADGEGYSQSNGVTPLAAAAANCHVETVEILMKWGADASRKVMLGSKEMSIADLVDKNDANGDKLLELLAGAGDTGKRKSGKK